MTDRRLDHHALAGARVYMAQQFDAAKLIAIFINPPLPATMGNMGASATFEPNVLC